MIVFSRERERKRQAIIIIVTSHVFLRSIDSWYRDSEQSIGDVRSPIRLDLYRPLGHVTSHCRVVYRGFVAESAGCMGPLLEIIARKIAPVADVNGAIRKRGRLPLPLKIRIKRSRKSFRRNFNGKDIRENRNATRGLHLWWGTRYWIRTSVNLVIRLQFYYTKSIGGWIIKLPKWKRYCDFYVTMEFYYGVLVFEK